MFVSKLKHEVLGQVSGEKKFQPFNFIIIVQILLFQKICPRANFPSDTHDHTEISALMSQQEEQLGF